MYDLPDVVITEKITKPKYRAKPKFTGNRRFYIQLGGNLDLLNIPARFNIQLGEDLQQDEAYTKKSAALLGCLSEWSNNISSQYIQDNFERLKQVGLNELDKKQNSKQKKENNPPIKITRESRTKTLSQLGGLFSLIEVLKKFDLNMGDDLQTNQEAKIKSAILIGSLKECFDQMSDIQIVNKLCAWEKIGYEIMEARNKNTKNGKYKLLKNT